jgi:hypothetical protein
VWVYEEQDWCSPGCERIHTLRECDPHGDPKKIEAKRKKAAKADWWRSKKRRKT